MIKRALHAAAAILPIGAFAALPLAIAQPAFAATTITPDTFADVASPDCANGHASGKCSIRGAVLRANTESGAVVIQLLAGTYTLTTALNTQSDDGTTGDLDITRSVTIQGAGAGMTTVSQGFEAGDRVIEVDSRESTVRATISDLKVTGGAISANASELDGGGILNDGAILTLHNLVVDANSTGGGINGGGVASNGGSLTVSNTTFSGNTANQNGGGLWINNAGAGPDSVSMSYFKDNISHGAAARDSGGGAIYHASLSNHSAKFSDILATGNQATAMAGGAIYDDSSPNVPVTYDRITLANNTAFYEGGGFYTAAGHPVITNATIDSNHQVALSDGIGFEDGGGVAVGQSLGRITLNNSTVTRNTTNTGSGGGIYLGRNETVVLHNTIVSGNTKFGGGSANCRNNLGTLTSNGHNLANDLSCALTATGDRQGTSLSAGLLDLADNGGPRLGAPGNDAATLTRALQAGSIAINTADNSNCPATDERGVTRPQGGTCDVGAYEFVAAVPVPTPTPQLPRAGSMPGTPATPGAAGIILVFLLAGVPFAIWRGVRKANRA